MNTPPVVPTPIETVQLSPNMHLQVWDTPFIVAYTFNDIRRDTIDAWYTHYNHYLTHLPEQTNSRALLDISTMGIALTPYVRDRASKLAHDHRGRYGFTAFIFSDRILGTAVEFFMRLTTRPYIQTRTFSTRDEAILWLHNSREIIP